MKEFKAGDKIKIKSWEEMEKEFGLDSDGDIDIEPCFVEGMKHLCEQTATIYHINNNNDIELTSWSNNAGDTNWDFGIDMIKYEYVRDTNFKVGDTVRIRTWEDMEEEFGLKPDFSGRDKIPCKFSFVKEMIPFCEKVAKITGIDEDDEEVFLSFNSKVDSDFDASFSTDMLEKVEPKEDKQEIYTYRKGNEVISELKINDEVIKTTKAKCCPTDTFDFNFGAKLSLERLFEETKDDKKEKYVYIKLLDNPYTFNKKGDILKAYRFNGGSAYVRTEDQIRSVGNSISKEWIYLEHKYEVLENYDPEEIKEEPAKVGDYIELIEANYSFDKVGMVLKVNEVKEDGIVRILPESYPEGSEVYYNNFVSNDGSWGYQKNWYKVLKDYVPPKKNYGKDLIGRKIEARTRFKVIKISEDRDYYDDLICKDEYIGKTAKFEYDFTVTDNPYGDEMGTFDKAYVEAIDEENGGICWRWDEIEILD